MKKFIVLFLCVALISPCSIFAKKQKQEIVTQDGAETNELSKEKENKKNSKAQAKRQAEEAKKKERELKSKGWTLLSEEGGVQKIMVKKNGENVSVENGVVKLQTYTENGSVGIFVTEMKSTWFPVIETSDLVDSTYVSLFVDGVEYRLNRSKKVQYNFVFDKTSIEANYIIPNVAQLKALYTIKDQNVLVSYTVENLDEKRHHYGIKAVYNTILGEHHKFHFSLSNEDRVGAETVITPSAKINAVVSSDEKHTAKFVFYGQDVVPPKMVVLANKNVIEDASLNALFKNGRSFNSVLSYNNSAVGLFWENGYLSSKETKSCSFKIVLSSYTMNAINTSDYNVQPAEENKEEAKPVPVEIPPETEYTDSGNEDDEYGDDDDFGFDKLSQPEQKPAESDLNYDFNTERNYLDPSINEEYVRRLLNEIEDLEHNDPALNREKIRELQKEIDEVINVLRSRR